MYSTSIDRAKYSSPHTNHRIDVLEQFLSKEESNVLRECFAGIWKIHTINDENREAIQDVCDDPIQGAHLGYWTSWELRIKTPERRRRSSDLGRRHQEDSYEWSRAWRGKRWIDLDDQNCSSTVSIRSCHWHKTNGASINPVCSLSFLLLGSEYGVFSSVLGGDEEVYQDHVFGHLFKTKVYWVAMTEVTFVGLDINGGRSLCWICMLEYCLFDWPTN